MEPVDSLIGLAEIALGFAGFTAIVVSFKTRPGEIPPVDRLRLLVLLAVSLGALLLCLFPMSLAYLELQPSSVWRIASCVQALYFVLVISLFVRGFLRLDPPSRGLISRGIVVLVIPTSVIIIAAQLLNSLGMFYPQFGVYLAGIIWLLLVAAIQFGRIVFVRPRNA